MKLIVTTDQRNDYWRTGDIVYLARCPWCGWENHAAAVASGACAWCGYDITDDKEVKYDPQREDKTE